MVYRKSKDAATLDLEGGQDGEQGTLLHQGAGMALEGKAPGPSVQNPLYAVPTAGTGSQGPRVSSKGGKPTVAPTAAAAADDDDEETFFERISNSAVVERLNALVDRIFQNYIVAVLMDVVGVLLFFFDIYTDALVVDALSKTEHRDWMVTTLVLILWHYAIMAVLVTAYLRRTTTKLNVLGLEESDSSVGGAAVLGSRRRHLWLLFVPVAVPGVVLLDVTMLFTSILPIVFPRLFVNFSSFLSNYNFSRFFIEFVFESIPQTILQMYIYHQLAQGRHAGSAQQRTVALSLTVSALNCLKYGWKLYKAADDAGLTLPDYFKYLLLLKGNYECSPSAMIAVINECCTVRKPPPGGAGGMGAGGGGGGPSSGDILAAAAGSGGGSGSGTVFIMNGFHLHRNKSQYGPAQQAYILLNAFDRIDGCVRVRRWVISGCPLASVNRILEKGIRAFRSLNTLEVNECALRGDTWKLVTRAIKRHKRLEKVKLIQTGVLAKYRNAKRIRVVTGLFKHSLGLRTVGLCLNWWNEDYLQNAVDMYLLDHPTLESLAIELPPGAPFAVGSAEPGVGVDSSHRGMLSRRASRRRSLTLGGADGCAAAGGASAFGSLPTARYDVRSRLAEAAAGGGRAAPGGGGSGGGGRNPRARPFFGVSGPAAGFMSPFSSNALTASPAAATAAEGGGGGVNTAAAAVLGWVQHGGAVLSDLASYVTDGAVSTIQGLAAVASGQPWGSADGGDSGSTPGVASPRYCWLLAAVLASAPALRSLYIHNHALPEAAAEGVGQLAAALTGNTRLTGLSLRGSAVGDAGAAALARALSGHNSTLQLLNLRRCQLHDEGVSALCFCLVENRGLRSLDLSHNRVQGQGPGPGPGGGQLAGLERVLRLNTSLQELRLEGWRDTFDNPQAASSLAAALAVNEGLRTLSLAGCCLTSHGASAMASALAVNTCLTTLDLSAACADGKAGSGGGGGDDGGSEGRIGDAGVAALGAALTRNRSLRELNLAGCRCGELGGAALREALRVNMVLQVLDLSGDGGAEGGAEGASLGFGGVRGCGSGGSSSGWSTPISAAAVATAMTGVDDESATCVFTALQSNGGLRVLRMRGANLLTLRAMRTAAEMLRRNDCLLELDLSNSTFVAASDAVVTAVPLLLQSGSSQARPQPPSATAAATATTAASLASRPPSFLETTQVVASVAGGAAAGPSPPLPPLQSSLSRLSLSSEGSGAMQCTNVVQHPPQSHADGMPTSFLHPHHQHRHQHQHLQLHHPNSGQNLHMGLDHRGGAPAAAGFAVPPPAMLRRNGSFASGLSLAASVGGLTGPGSVAAAAAAGGVGGGGGGGGGIGGEEGLSPEAWEVVGAMWSALAGGLAANGRLRVLRLSYCGLGSVGVAALAPALVQNTSLQELDLAGVPAATARTHLAVVITKATSAAAAAAAAAAFADPSISSPPASPSPAAAAVGGGGVDCSLTSIRATDESYEVVDLLGASKVTSRAAEEAAAAAEEAMRVPRDRGGGGRGGGGDSLLLGEGGGGGRAGGSSGSGPGMGRGWRWWRRR